MTVSTTTSAVVYTADGSTATFPYTWQIVQAADLVVYKTSADGLTLTLLTLTTDYTVSGAGISTGGNVVLVAGNPAAGIKVFIASDPLQIQQLLLQQGTDFNPAQIMAALDLLTREMQATRRVANLGLRFPVSEALAGLTSVAPTAAARANKYPAFDVNGNLVLSTGTGSAIADGSITTPKFNGSAKAPFAGAADTATTAGSATTAGFATTAGLATTAASATTAATANSVAANGVNAAAIQANAVDNTKLADMTAATVKGRALGAGTGDPTDLTGTQVNDIIRAAVLTNNKRGILACSASRGLKYVSALDKILCVESVVNGRIMAIDPITDYPVPVYTSAKTPKGLCYTTNSARIWLPNGTTDLFSVNPSGWTTDVASAGERSDYILYNANDGFLYGFDNAASKIKVYDTTTGVKQAEYASGGTNIASTSEIPWALDPVSNCIYFIDGVAGFKKFNCTTHAFTTLTNPHAGPSTSSGILLGSDGYLYITDGGATAKYTISVWNPATDTLVTTIDLSSNLAATAGFLWCYEWRGYLYAACIGTSPVPIICVIDMATRTLVGSIIGDLSGSSPAFLGNMAASPTALRAYVGCAVAVGFTSYLAFDR